MEVRIQVQGGYLIYPGFPEPTGVAGCNAG